MGSTHLSDKELIEKLENVASLTNKDVLSIKEVSRGRLLRSKARDMLASSNMTQAYQSNLTLPDHIARLSIALAPHKRLPSEILEKIFLSGSEGLGIVELPPVLSDYRWVLGRVCSTWRQVSRSIPFWETKFAFGPEQIIDERAYDLARSWKHIQFTIDILPKIAFIHLSVNFLPPKALVPYLAHFKALDWKIFEIGKTQQELVEVFPPGAFSHLESLHFTLPCPEKDHMRPFVDLFGEAPHLRHLHFLSKDPTFLLCDIPWSQLQSFELSSGCTSEITHFVHIWVQLAQRDPFHLMTSLEHLILQTDARSLRILLPCKFPWQRLKTLNIEWCETLEARDLLLFMESLQNCTSLLSLKVRYTGRDIPVVPVDPIFLPSLQTLEEYCLPPFIIIAVSSSGTLRSLKSQGVMALQDFYTITAKCSNLTSCDVNLAYGAFAEQIPAFITLPHLTSLWISFEETSSFPTMIIAPLLTSLHITTLYSGPNPFRIITDFIVQSKMQLQHFYCVFQRTDDYEEIIKQHLPFDLLHKFLASLESCHRVNIAGVKFTQQILDEVASGILLPHAIDCLGIGTSNADVALAFIRNFLEQQAPSGRILPRTICSFIPFEVFTGLTKTQLEQLGLDLGELSERYQVKCFIQWA